MRLQSVGGFQKAVFLVCVVFVVQAIIVSPDSSSTLKWDKLYEDIDFKARFVVKQRYGELLNRILPPELRSRVEETFVLELKLSAIEMKDRADDFAQEKRRLSDDLANLTIRFNILETDLSNCKWTMATRQIIDKYENEFNKYENEVELDSTNLKKSVPKFKRDNQLIKNFKNYYDQVREIRRQKWVHYLTYPPTTLLQSLANVVTEKSTIPEFADGIAEAYDLLSEMFHKGKWKAGQKPEESHLSYIKKSNRAIDILLSTVDLDDRIFVYKSNK